MYYAFYLDTPIVMFFDTEDRKKAWLDLEYWLEEYNEVSDLKIENLNLKFELNSLQHKIYEISELINPKNEDIDLVVGQTVEIAGIMHTVSKSMAYEMYYMNIEDSLTNDAVFLKLGLDPILFCSRFYDSFCGGSWPYAPDLKSLTKCVNALINYKK